MTVDEPPALDNPCVAGALRERAALVEAQGGNPDRATACRHAADTLALQRRVPGTGAALALRLHEELGLDTLEALEAAAHDGRPDGKLPTIAPRCVSPGGKAWLPELRTGGRRHPRSADRCARPGDGNGSRCA